MSFRTISSLRFPIGTFGKSLVFDGSNDFATIPGIIPSTASFSWSCWIKIPADSPAFGRIFDYYDDTRGTRFLYDSTVNKRFNFDAANGSVISAVTPSNYSKNAEWVHFCGIYNGTTISLYMMGTLIQSQTKTMTAPTVPQVLTLGRASGASSSFGKFSIAHLAWDNDNVWTDDERLDATYLHTYPDSASWYDFRDSVADQSGNGNDITLDEGTTYSTDAPFSTSRSQVTSRSTVGEASSFNFSSSSGRIDCTANTTRHNNEFTFCGFIRPENAGTNRVIIGWSGNGTPQFSLGTGDNLRLVKQNTAGIALSTMTFQSGIWYWVACTYAANGDYKLYACTKDLEPVVIATGNAVQTWTYGTSNMYIGNLVGFGQAFRGLGRSFKMFNRALSLAELKQAKIENSYNKLSGCVGFYEGNEGSGTQAIDKETGITGTLTNITYSSSVLFLARS